MKRKVFSFTAIAAMCAMPIITNADDETVGQKIDKAADKVADAVTPQEVRNDATQAPQLPAGVKAKENDDVHDLRESLVTIVNRTLTKGSFDGAVSYLANQDRDRINKQLEDVEYEDALNQKIDTFRAAFREKYGEDFELKTGMLDDVTFVQQGEVTDAAALRQAWPLQVMGERQDATPAADRPVNDDPKIENGRDVATVKLAAGDMSPLTLSMQYELPNYWVLDVPNNVGGQALIDSQQKSIDKIMDMKDQWPRTKEQAYRNIAYTIIKGTFPGVGEGPMANTPRD
jgi:hypothetical protein